MNSLLKTHGLLRRWLQPAVTLGSLALLSWGIVHWDLDRAIASWFYADSEGGYLAKRQPWQWLYKFGA